MGLVGSLDVRAQILFCGYELSGLVSVGTRSIADVGRTWVGSSND